MSLDQEWESYLNQSLHNDVDETIDIITSEDLQKYEETELPKCDELYISTTTKVLFLNQSIDIDNIFWEIPIVDYWKPTPGVIKKQMKVVSHTKEMFEEYCEKLPSLKYYNEHIIKKLDNPNARRNKFKDERKITVGISKKDIMNITLQNIFSHI